MRSRKINGEDRKTTPRYYADLKRKVRSFKVDLIQRQWCDLWHQHCLWMGTGNDSWLDRHRQSLQFSALFHGPG